MLAAFLSFSFVILAPIKLQYKGFFFFFFADLDQPAIEGELALEWY